MSKTERTFRGCVSLLFENFKIIFSMEAFFEQNPTWKTSTPSRQAGSPPTPHRPQTPLGIVGKLGPTALQLISLLSAKCQHWNGEESHSFLTQQLY